GTWVYGLLYARALEGGGVPPDVPRRRDERRHASVRRAHHRHAMLDRPERVHGQMLPRPGRTTKPCVVRHVHDQARAILHEFTDELGEDPFVADHHGKRGWRAREDTRAGARLEPRD